MTVVSKKVMLSVKELIDEINGRDGVFSERGICQHYFSVKNEKLLHLILTEAYIKGLDSKLQEALSGRTLSDLMTAKGGKSAVVGERLVLAQKIGEIRGDDEGDFRVISNALIKFSQIFSEENLHKDFVLKNLPGVYEMLIKNPVSPREWIADNSSLNKRKELHLADKQLDIVRKSILYLYGTKQYPLFFWWLFIFAIFQSEIVQLMRFLPENQYGKIVAYLEEKNEHFHEIRQKPLVQIKGNEFMELRRKIVETACGHLLLVGPSLKNAFDVGEKNSIIKQLRNAIRMGNLNELTIMLTDPLLFQGTKCYAPVRAVDGTISSLEDNFYELCERNGVKLNVCFLMTEQIDHAVISEEFMLFRSNKLWTDQRELKGGYILSVADYYAVEKTEYRAHLDYLNLIMTLSNHSHPEVDVDHEEWDRQDMRYYHRQWRKHLRNSGFGNVHFHYLFRDQLHNYMCQTWLPELE